MTSHSVPITLYWRPGCGFCAMLRNRLDDLGVSYDPVNIWDDPQAAKTVRSLNGGNELVPTIVIGTTTLSNPSAPQVMEAIKAEASTADT